MKKNLSKIGHWIVAHKQQTLVIIVLIIAVIVGLWRYYSDSALPVPEDGTKQEEVTRFEVGWSNLAIFGILAGALVFVRYKKSLLTKKDDIKEREDKE
jgi:hypothetical protein